MRGRLQIAHTPDSTHHWTYQDVAMCMAPNNRTAVHFGGIFNHFQPQLRSPTTPNRQKTAKTAKNRQNPVSACPSPHFPQILWRQLKPMHTTDAHASCERVELYIIGLTPFLFRIEQSVRFRQPSSSQRNTRSNAIYIN
jgi:hypothetical protein